MRLVQVGANVICQFNIYQADGYTHWGGQAGACVTTLWFNGGVSGLAVTVNESGNGYYAEFTPDAQGSYHLEIHDPNNTLWGADIQAGPYTDVYCHLSCFNPDGYTKLTGQAGACTYDLWEDGAVSAIPVTINEIGVSGEYYGLFTVGTADLYWLEITTPTFDVWKEIIEPKIGFGGGATLPISGVVQASTISGVVVEDEISGVVETTEVTGTVETEDITGTVDTDDITGEVE